MTMHDFKPGDKCNLTARPYTRPCTVEAVSGTMYDDRPGSDLVTYRTAFGRLETRRESKLVFVK